jgi:drug/metabolite transporter (DMT)-like permease
LRAYRLPPSDFLVVALFFTAVGLGQMLLFKGQRPRRASMIAGACFFPVLSVVDWFVLRNPMNPRRVAFTPFDLVGAIIVGAIYGYAAGTLIAGVFLLIDKRALARQARKLS